MKNFKSFIVLAITAIALMIGFTNCEPEEVDAFADGYRRGYEGSY